jgi:hypothetical protein
LLIKKLRGNTILHIFWRINLHIITTAKKRIAAHVNCNIIVTRFLTFGNGSDVDDDEFNEDVFECNNIASAKG